ncbi:MAG: phosphate acyltransferase, partial [Actinomycetia bacterium]|nr:phosphate acyltransferase [Actinomycetes bacterium]
MGGDFAPAEVIRGALKAGREYGAHVILVGNTARIREAADSQGLDISH